ncbi:corticotropin-releasing factor receptor 1-like [Oppia nitens]|uniref:corticotropin-releasing factor receptor 1-like n=1 Tax=Oppia nitens TaxID=1686743 RepID=UPI0023DB24A6|nr:corticotropin-releasing factor receptor 1-like [Oppia nitens]
MSNVVDLHTNEDINFKSLDNFTDAMCARCYWYMAGVPDAWRNDTIVNLEMRPIWWPNTVRMCFVNIEKRHANCDYEFNYTKIVNDLDHNIDTNIFLRQFRSKFYMNLFLDCCSDARICCRKQLAIAAREAVTRPHLKRCPAKWDGWMCWDSAAPDTVQRQTCPGMSHAVLGYTPTDCSKEKAVKHCLSNGTWAVKWLLNNENDPKSGYYEDEDTIYNRCSRPETTKRQQINQVSNGILFLSLITSLIGIIIFIVYKQYHVLRVQIHLNFFCSIILTCTFTLLFNYLIRESFYDLRFNVNENTKWCRALTILMKFSRLTNYCWMLNEGAYLHRMIVVTFADERRPVFYYLFGWVAPLLVMIPYVIVHSLESYDKDCWTQPMLYPELIWDILPLCCIFLNAVLLLNVIRVLIMKLRSSPDHFRAGLRASLILLPVFGIQYTFYVVDVDPFNTCSTGMFVAKYIQTIIEALQGTIVTTIFCFLNGEVHSHIKRTVRKIIPRGSVMVTEQQDIEKST